MLCDRLNISEPIRNWSEFDFLCVHSMDSIHLSLLHLGINRFRETELVAINWIKNNPQQEIFTNYTSHPKKRISLTKWPRHTKLSDDAKLTHIDISVIGNAHNILTRQWKNMLFIYAAKMLTYTSHIQSHIVPQKIFVRICSICFFFFNIFIYIYLGISHCILFYTIFFNRYWMYYFNRWVYNTWCWLYRRRKDTQAKTNIFGNCKRCRDFPKNCSQSEISFTGLSKIKYLLDFTPH